MPTYESNSIPRVFVLGSGSYESRVVFVGEAPGEQENRSGVPFIGQAGEELNRYLRSAGIERKNVYVTNVCKYWPLVSPLDKQLPPTPEDIARDEADLLMELDIIQPEIIGAIGAHASRYFLGDRFGSLRRDHGIPREWVAPWWKDIAVVPLTHPAAALHSGTQEEQARIQWDFQQIGKLLRGQLAPIEPTDAYPHPMYRRLSDDDDGPEILSGILADRAFLYIDTEGTIANPWCVTVSVVPGEGWLIRSTERRTLTVLNAHINAPGASRTVACHYLAHDIPVLSAMGVEVDRRQYRNPDGSPSLRCTMLEAHLLGGIEPKGLKPLMWRLAGIEGESYEDVVGEAEYAITRGYLERVSAVAACASCNGTGESELSYKVIDEACPACAGSGRVAGKRAGTTKWCGCVKTKNKCRECIDGLTVPRPDKELVFDAKTGNFRWKQPQSAARWIKRRLNAKSLLAVDEDDDDSESTSVDDDSSGDDEPTSTFFKLRKDWEKSPVSPTVERLYGRIPHTTLSDVKDQDRVTAYACRDSDAGLRICDPLTARLTEHKLLTARDIDARMIPMLSSMEQSGMMIDRGHFESFSTDLGREMSEIQQKLTDLVGERNPNSRRLADVLFRQLGLPTVKLTKGGQEALDDEVLETLKQQIIIHRPDAPDGQTALDVIGCIQDYRERQKLKSTYVDVYLEKADRNDRIHTTLKYTQSMTRLSSEDPNLQNLGNPDNHPAGNDPIKNTSLRLRNGVVARPGYKLISCDYSSIEMVVGAHLSQDVNLLRIFHEGLDPHRYAGFRLTGTPMNDIPKAIRTQCKKLNFSAFYDTSAPTLQKQFSLMAPPIIKTVEECEELIVWYFSDFAPGVGAWKQEVRKQAQIDGCVRTMFGRLRWMPGLRSNIKRVRSAAERECTNAPIQGTAGDILRIAMGDLHEHTFPAIWAEGIDAQPIMTVHDEVLVEAEEEYAELVGEMVRQTMLEAVKLSVPIKVGLKIGDRWGQLE